jgi:hypothetical protein
MLWRLHRSGKQSSMRFPPGTRIRDATKFGLQVLRPFIDMSRASRNGLMAMAMGSAASHIEVYELNLRGKLALKTKQALSSQRLRTNAFIFSDYA